MRGDRRKKLELLMRTSIRFALTLSLLVAMTGCSRAKPIGLAIEGYNYTNRYIATFTVTDENGNGSWGGNVELSTPTAGGSKSTCCVMLDPNLKKSVRLRVDWTLDEIEDAAGRTVAPEIKKSAWVTIAPPFPDDPQNLEVHFYPDGHVEAAVTHWSSPPRILLRADRRPAP